MNYFQELCTKLHIDYTDIDSNDLFTVSELIRWLNMSKDEAAARNPWPFTEGEKAITSVANQEEYLYPTVMKSDSLRYLTVNDKRYQKLAFEDYLNYKENYSSGQDKYFSDRNRTLYINCKVSGFGGSIVCYGQILISGAITSASTTTVFSPGEPEGEEAIVKLAYSKALSSDKMKNPAKGLKERTEAFEILDGIYERIKDRQPTYQTKDRPLFKGMNVLKGGYVDDIRNRKQF